MSDFFSFSGFPAPLNYWIFSGFLLALLSFFFHFQKKDRLALGLLTAAGAAFFVFAALADPFLNPWDERFHALVAKNCMSTPFQPTLYSELPFREEDPLIWSHAHIWLHKQPLFTWQIALSFRLFGVSEFTLRLPSVIQATLLIPIVYRCSSLLINRRLGYFAATSVAFSWFLINLVSGNADVDHNNVCFVFYVTASIWAWTEYLHSGRKWGWALLAGLLSGCAVLTKWLTGLVVYLIWGIYLLAEYRFRVNEWKLPHCVAAFAISMAVFLPWQLYTAHAFPDVYQREAENNKHHFTSVLEEHGHSSLYYLKTASYRYCGDRKIDPKKEETMSFPRIVTSGLLVLGLALLFWRLPRRSFRWALGGTLVFVYLFFSFAATKMLAYPFCLCLLGFMSLGMLPAELENFLQKQVRSQWARTAVLLPVLAVFAFYQFNFHGLRNRHTQQSWNYNLLSDNAKTYRALAKKLPERTILFNVRGDEEFGNHCQPIDAMFYTGALCYATLPSEVQLQQLKKEGYRIAVLTTRELPDFIADDAEVLKIKASIRGDF